jgi:hypothetical protein
MRFSSVIVLSIVATSSLASSTDTTDDDNKMCTIFCEDNLDCADCDSYCVSINSFPGYDNMTHFAWQNIFFLCTVSHSNAVWPLALTRELLVIG